MSYNYLEEVLNEIDPIVNLDLGPGKKDLELKFKTELDDHRPLFDLIMKAKLNSVFSSLVTQGLTLELAQKVENASPLLTAVMFALMHQIINNRDITDQQIEDNFILMSQLVFTDDEIDRVCDVIRSEY